jgi:hypothetical protein
MSNWTASWRRRHAAARTRRAINQALDRSSSPGMEQELRAQASRQWGDLPR